MTTRTGTHHFVSRDAAVRYYAQQDIDAREVERKLKAEEIAIGEPPPRDGYRFIVEPSEGRYFMEEIALFPLWERKLWLAREVLREKGREALDNPAGIAGRKCKCGNCDACAAAYVVAEYDQWLKPQIYDALGAWIRKRPRLNHRDYYDVFDRGEVLKAGVAAYRRAQGEVGRDKRDAETLLAAARSRADITGSELIEAFKQAFSGRLELRLDVLYQIREGGKMPYEEKRVELYYTGGQDPHTEYRAAAAAVLAYVLRQHASRSMPKPTHTHGSATDTGARHDGLTAGDWIRKHFRKEFGSMLQRRWFN